MVIIAKEISSDFIPLNKGIHLAICDALIDVGVQKTPWGNKRKICLRFEVPAERIQKIRDGEKIDEPATIWQWYTINLHKKATLRAHLVAWRGKKFTGEELKGGFDLSVLVGEPCQIIVVHNEVDGRTYANISAITEVKQGQEIPPQELPSIVFGPEDTDQWNDVPEWLQEKFDNRVQPEDLKSVSKPEEPKDDFVKDDIPF